MTTRQIFAFLLWGAACFAGGAVQAGRVKAETERRAEKAITALLREEQDLADMLDKTHNDLEQCVSDLNDARGPKGF